MLLAESAILLHLKAIGVILLVLHGVVVSLLAFVASERDLHSHCRHLLNFASLLGTAVRINLTTPELPRRPAAEKAQKNKPLFTGMLIIAYEAGRVNRNFQKNPTFFVFRLPFRHRIWYTILR